MNKTTFVRTNKLILAAFLRPHNSYFSRIFLNSAAKYILFLTCANYNNMFYNMFSIQIVKTVWQKSLFMI